MSNLRNKKYGALTCYGCDATMPSSLQPFLCGLGLEVDGRERCPFTGNNSPRGWDWTSQNITNTLDKAKEIWAEWRTRVEADQLNNWWLEHEAALDLLAACILPLKIGDVELSWDYISNPCKPTAAEQLADFVGTDCPFGLHFTEDACEAVKAHLRELEEKRRGYQSEADKAREELKKLKKKKSPDVENTLNFMKEKRELEEKIKTLTEKLSNVEDDLENTTAAKITTKLEEIDAWFKEVNDLDSTRAWEAMREETLAIMVDGGIGRRRAILKFLECRVKPDDADRAASFCETYYAGLMALHGNVLDRWLGASKKFFGRVWKAMPNVSDRLAKLREKVKGIHQRFTNAKAKEGGLAMTRSWWSVTKADFKVVYNSVGSALSNMTKSVSGALLGPVRVFVMAPLALVASGGKAVYNSFKRLFGFAIAPLWPSARDEQVEMEEEAHRPAPPNHEADADAGTV